MSIDTRPPSRPLEAKEYALMSAKDSRKLFPGADQLHRKWGMLRAVDQQEEHWTLLGTPGETAIGFPFWFIRGRPDEWSAMGKVVVRSFLGGCCRIDVR
jgi:hypothetical protein